MLQKIWSFLTDGIHRREPQPIVPLPYEKSPRPQTSKTNSRLNYELKEAPQQKGDFVLIPKNDNQFKEKLKSNPVEQEQSQGVIDVVRELQEKFKKLSIEQKNLEEAQRRSPIYISKDPRQLKINITEKQNQNYFRKEYQVQITTFLQCKYSKQRLDYPEISFQDFKKIRCYWRQRRRSGEIKKTSLDAVQAITFKAMGGIDHGQWLNDDIINAYLQLLDRNCAKQGSIRLLNSFFATTYLQKDEKMIQRFLKKKNIEPQHRLIMPINYGNHWFFATLSPQSIRIYDSLRKKQEYYQEMPIFKNALKFGRFFYGNQPRLDVSLDYPQQNNGNDCGVFMLMGIRDTLLGRKTWTYLQGDIRFKRIQLANEVLHETIMFGNPSLT